MNIVETGNCEKWKLWKMEVVENVICGKLKYGQFKLWKMENCGKWKLWKLKLWKMDYFNKDYPRCFTVTGRRQATQRTNTPTAILLLW